jgi:hypothetical protein
MHNSSENTCSTSNSTNQNKLENGIKSYNTITRIKKERELGGNHDSKDRANQNISRESRTFEVQPNTTDRLREESDSVQTHYTTSYYPICNYSKYSKTTHVGSQIHRPCF